MTWISSGDAVVQKQRGHWVVRLPGYDGATGKLRPKRVGTFATESDALATAKRVGSGGAGTGERTLGVFLTQVWLPSMAETVEATKLERRRRVVADHILPLLGEVRFKHASGGR